MQKPKNTRVELARADEAAARLVAYLRELEDALAGRAQGQAPRGRAASHRAALQALQRHALITLEEFAFVDGARISEPHDTLLTAFYPDPDDVVASRYCWALLREASHLPPRLDRLIGATLREQEAFRQAQLPRDPSPTEDAAAELEEILREEDTARLRADRLAYTCALLQRLQLACRHESRQQAQSLRDLDREIARLMTAKLRAHRELAQLRLKRIAVSRRGR